MDCERFIEKFAKAQVTLEEFLTIDDKKMIEIGIIYPYQRNMIKLGLWKFHNTEWRKTSFWIPPKFKTNQNSLSLVYLMANMMRQLVVVRSTIEYLKNLGAIYNMRSCYDYIYTEQIEEMKVNIAGLKKEVKKLNKLKQERPLHIKKRPVVTLVDLVVVAIPISICAFFKIRQYLKF